jgi:hypothetical protein
VAFRPSIGMVFKNTCKRVAINPFANNCAISSFYPDYENKINNLDLFLFECMLIVMPGKSDTSNYYDPRSFVVFYSRQTIITSHT